MGILRYQGVGPTEEGEHAGGHHRAEERERLRQLQAVNDDAVIDEFPQFFEGAKLNFAENLLAGKVDGLAIIEMNESNMAEPERYSWQDLRGLVQGYADALKASGLNKGEVVARECSPKPSATNSDSELLSPNSRRIQLRTLVGSFAGNGSSGWDLQLVRNGHGRQGSCD